LETHYQNAKALIDKLSQSVLAKAFRGELVPYDPNDVPAEKLWERIMEEKAKMIMTDSRNLDGDSGPGISGNGMIVGICCSNQI